MTGRIDWTDCERAWPIGKFMQFTGARTSWDCQLNGVRLHCCSLVAHVNFPPHRRGFLAGLLVRPDHVSTMLCYWSACHAGSAPTPVLVAEPSHDVSEIGRICMRKIAARAKHVRKNRRRFVRTTPRTGETIWGYSDNFFLHPLHLTEHRLNVIRFSWLMH